MPQVPIEELLPPEPAARRWSAYPSHWLRTERFWMEVTTRTVAGVLSVGIIAVIGYTYALLAGYVAVPNWSGRILSLILPVYLISALFASFGIFRRAFNGKRRVGTRIRLILFACLFLAGGISMALLLPVLAGD